MATLKIINGPVTGVVGTVSFFGLIDALESCFNALYPVIANVHSLNDLCANISSLNTLEQGGAFLYALLALASGGGLALAIFILLSHHYRVAKHHVMKHLPSSLRRHPRS